MKTTIKITGLFLALAFLLVSCNPDDGVNQFCIEAPQADCFCTLDYDPVCGCNGVTYPNACVAECSNIINYTPGTCN